MTCDLTLCKPYILKRKGYLETKDPFDKFLNDKITLEAFLSLSPAEFPCQIGILIRFQKLVKRVEYVTHLLGFSMNFPFEESIFTPGFPFSRIRVCFT